MQSHGADTSSQDICVAPVAFGERQIGPSILSHGVWLRWSCHSDASSVEVAAALLARSASESPLGPSLEALGLELAWKPLFFACVFSWDLDSSDASKGSTSALFGKVYTPKDLFAVTF